MRAAWQACTKSAIAVGDAGAHDGANDKGLFAMAVIRDSLILVLGGSGYVGGHVVEALARHGARVRIASRHPEKQWAARLSGDLGCVEFARADVRDEASVARALQGADGVVNLVGAFGGDLDAVQGRGVGRIAAAAQAAGASAFVHVSAIGADAGSNVAYASSKAAGEAAALAGFAGATVLRPSVIFGADDNFINMFAGLMRMVAALPVPNVMPVFVGEGRLQPVFVGDVAAAAVAALEQPEAAGKTYELGGPEVVTMLGLNRRIAAALGIKMRFLSVPDLAAAIFALLPGAPISRDQIALLKAGNLAAEGSLGLGDLGLSARPMGLFLEHWLRR